MKRRASYPLTGKFIGIVNLLKNANQHRGETNKTLKLNLKRILIYMRS